MNIDLTTPVQTRNGSKARILAVDLAGATDFPVVAAVTYPSGEELLHRFKADGTCSGYSHPLDLVPIPPKRIEVFLNICRKRAGHSWLCAAIFDASELVCDANIIPIGRAKISYDAETGNNLTIEKV